MEQTVFKSPAPVRPLGAAVLGATASVGATSLTLTAGGGATLGTDYPYRARIDREAVAQRLAEAVRSIRYPNFKATVAEDDRHGDVDRGADAEEREGRPRHAERPEGVGPEAKREEVREEGAMVGVAVAVIVSGVVAVPVPVEDGGPDQDEAEGQRGEIDGQHGATSLRRAREG